MIITKKSQQGFTLVELMIALVLGLIIMFAVTKVYTISVRTAAMQQAGSSILDANVFGLQQVERNLRLAGLDLSEVSSFTTAGSGIITHVSNVNASGFDANWVTGVSKQVPKSSRSFADQLTIQYRAPTDMRDCEGVIALGPRKAKITIDTDVDTEPRLILGQVVVERYYLKENNGNLELYCDASRYVTDQIIEYNDSEKPVENTRNAEKDKEMKQAIIKQPNVLVKTGKDGGVLVTAGVDDFKVQLVTLNGNNLSYVTPAQYASSPNGIIVAVKTAILTRGSLPITGGGELPSSYEMLGESVTLRSKQDNKYIRRVYESNTMLRNSRGN